MRQAEEFFWFMCILIALALISVTGSLYVGDLIDRGIVYAVRSICGEY